MTDGFTIFIIVSLKRREKQCLEITCSNKINMVGALERRKKTAMKFSKSLLSREIYFNLRGMVSELIMRDMR
jgi:hypothetical protein